MKTKVVALYLPQFHVIPENNEWWGNGFTEWTNVRRAIPLFENHYQPRVPLDNNYYDLSDDFELINQMETAREYGVDAFCFYHYWFQGKKLLEKPVEHLLEKKTPIKYFLSWANEPWTRTWDGINGSREILQRQEYGGFSEWRAHFEYLYSFFESENYLYIDDKPVFVIYKPSQIPCLKEMLTEWNRLAKLKGLAGIYLISTHRSSAAVEYNNWKWDAVFDFEPFATKADIIEYKMDSINKHQGYLQENRNRIYDVIDFEMFCGYFKEKIVLRDCKHFRGTFVGWDNTARRGIETSIIFDNVKPEIFEKYFDYQYKISIENSLELLFVNAWNEWAEGAYLQPDNRHGYGYLQAIKNVKERYKEDD